MRGRLAEVSFDEVSEETVVATVTGEVDGSNAGELRRAIADRIPATARTLVLDLAETAYVDSTGVELLFELAGRLSARRQTLTVIATPGSGVRRVLELCDISSVAELAGSREDAGSG